MRIRLPLAVSRVIVAAALVGCTLWPRPPAWTAHELTVLRSLWIGSLGPVPGDPSNAVAVDPRAASLGQKLFFDKRFSVNGAVACTTCHLPSRDFTDGRALAQGVGTTSRTAMPIAGAQYSPWLFWDGSKDSQWAQALGPLESPVEHGGSRAQYAELIARHYASDYTAIFGPLPPDLEGEAATRVFVNMGKAIAAFERLILPGRSRFDAFVENLLASRHSAHLSSDEVAGLRLFAGKAACATCHLGPLLTNHDFHNTGVPAINEPAHDRGRADGARRVREDEFSCLSRWSDAPPSSCAELRFLKSGAHDQERQFKVPSLRNVTARGPYMHAGQFVTLREVLDHYNVAPAAPVGHSGLAPLGLSTAELRQIEAFLQTLSAPPVAPAF